MDSWVAAILRRMIKQGMSTEDITAQPTTKLKAMAAVAYILLHREQFLDEQNRLRMSYGALLARLSGYSPYETSALVKASQKLGLHIGHKSLKGEPYIPGTYWTVEIVIPQKRKTVLQIDVVTVLRRAYRGDITKEEIPHLQTTAEQVGAAVGYVLCHSSIYIDEYGRVMRPYPALLAELTQRSEGEHHALMQSSGRHGLHRLASSMPGNAVPGVRKPVVLTTLVELERQVGLVSQEEPGNAALSVESDAERARRIAKQGLREIYDRGGEAALDMALILLQERRL